MDPLLNASSVRIVEIHSRLSSEIWDRARGFLTLQEIHYTRNVCTSWRDVGDVKCTLRFALNDDNFRIDDEERRQNENSIRLLRVLLEKPFDFDFGCVGTLRFEGSQEKSFKPQDILNVLNRCSRKIERIYFQHIGDGLIIPPRLPNLLFFSAIDCHPRNIEGFFTQENLIEANVKIDTAYVAEILRIDFSKNQIRKLSLDHSTFLFINTNHAQIQDLSIPASFLQEHHLLDHTQKLKTKVFYGDFEDRIMRWLPYALNLFKKGLRKLEFSLSIPPQTVIEVECTKHMYEISRKGLIDDERIPINDLLEEFKKDEETLVWQDAENLENYYRKQIMEYLVEIKKLLDESVKEVIDDEKETLLQISSEKQITKITNVTKRVRSADDVDRNYRQRYN